MASASTRYRARTRMMARMRMSTRAPILARARILAATALVALSACIGADAAQSEDEILRQTPGYVVDTVHSPAEEIRRFQTGLAPVTTLSGGASDRDSLVRRYMDAMDAGDSLALRAMHLDRSEFGYIYFPDTKFATELYALPPGVVWFQITAGSNKGLTRASKALKGRGARYEGHSCNDTPEEYAGYRLWTECVVRMRVPGREVVSDRLFGSIIERQGQFKFVSYANGL
jgi:hypothetical protein